MEIDETVNFQNFRKLFPNDFVAFFVAFWHPVLNWNNETKWQGTESILQWPSLVHCIGEGNVATRR